MLAVTIAAVLVGAAGIALAYRMIQADTRTPADPSPWRWTPMDLLIQAAGWAVLLLSVARSLRHRHARDRYDARQETRNG